MRSHLASLAAIGLLAAACATAAPAATLAPSETVTATPLATPSPSPSPTPDPPRPTGRDIVEQDWAPFATTAGITLHHPSRRVELIGFHESTHEGAQQLTVTATVSPWVAMETRDRGSPSRSAADIVVDPASEIRSPVTGTVKRAGSYTLYCDHTDHFLVITPDGRDDLEVKMLHFEGLAVGVSDRVEAGVTVVGSGARLLPFESQVDEHTAQPSWPHVHVELVDTDIPNIPGDGPAC